MQPPTPPLSPEYWEHSWQNRIFVKQQNMKLYKLLVISLLTNFRLYKFNNDLIFFLSFACLIRRNFYICIFNLQRLEQSVVAIPCCPVFMGNWSVFFFLGFLLNSRAGSFSSLAEFFLPHAYFTLKSRVNNIYVKTDNKTEKC